MNNPTSFLTSWASQVRGPVQVGLSRQQDRWHVVMHEPDRQGWLSGGPTTGEDASQRLQHRQWPADPSIDVFATRMDAPAGASPDDMTLASWQSALEALQHVLPAGVCHLVISWPDDALWSTTITLAGPVTEAEIPALLQQELALVMPMAAVRAAWDARALNRSAPSMGVSEGDVAMQCWAMPLELAARLERLCWQHGFASLSIEPSSVSTQRAAELQRSWSEPVHVDAPPSWCLSPERAEAIGAACRPERDGVDVLRHRAMTWRVRGKRWLHRYGRALSACAVTMGLGGALGNAIGDMHQAQWARDQQAWARRLHELQASHQSLEQAQRAQQQFRVQLREHDERQAYNQRFAHILQGWAATVPDGVQWQRLTLQPQRIDLHGQALSADSFTRWIDQWPQTLPAGVRHQLQWQTVPGPSVDRNAASRLGLQVQLWWGSAGARE